MCQSELQFTFLLIPSDVTKDICSVQTELICILEVSCLSLGYRIDYPECDLALNFLSTSSHIQNRILKYVVTASFFMFLNSSCIIIILSYSPLHNLCWKYSSVKYRPTNQPTNQPY